ncbi:MAG: orotate phosphoribosyltransferase [Candidatus Hinthialibacter antarcticus]|nr:orotate phosphoribosyltransferase [Candidatus Hinthialibacter antarcticus]
MNAESQAFSTSRIENLLSLDIESVRKQAKRMLIKRALHVARDDRNFVLASGQPSKYFVDGKRVTMRADGLAILSRLVWEEIRDLDIDAIGGPTLGADPLAAGVSMMSYMAGRPIDFFVVRKERQQHGLGRRIEGADIANKRIALLEDVITTGASLLSVIQAVREQDAEVKKIVAVVCRQDTAAETFAKGNMEYTSLFSLSELLDAAL